MAQIDDSINDARQVATEKAQQAVAYTDAAILAAQGSAQPSALPPIVAPVVNPPAFIPNNQLANTFKTEFDAIWLELDNWMNGKMSNWVNTYFPILDPTLVTSENTWLLNVIQNGYIGIPLAVETAIWNRGRSREQVEGLRMEAEAVSAMAARGFSMPPGVLANRLQTAQQDIADKASTISRELTIKNIEITVEMTKLAITEVSKLRVGLADALANFIRTMMELPKSAGEIARAEAEMYRYLWQGSAEYANSMANIARLSLDASINNNRNSVDLQKLSVDSFNINRKLNVDAAMEAAREMGAIAASAQASQNTLVGDVTNTNS